MTTYKNFSTRKTPQNQAIPGENQVRNSAGGFVYSLDKWSQLERFLILGTEGNTYYVGSQKLTEQNALSVIDCIKEDGQRVVNTILDVSWQGRALKNDQALFALAMCASLGDDATRKAAFDALPKVARIGTHLFNFAQYVGQFRGWGRGLRKAVANWYTGMPDSKLAYQAVKYQSRNGWSHRDLLRLAHPVPTSNIQQEVFGWITKGTLPEESNVEILQAFEAAKRAESSAEICHLIANHGLPREAIPTRWLNDVSVWDALLQNMPLTALVRNLGKMTSVGLISPLSDATGLVTAKLRDGEYLRKSRVHPLAVLVAMKVYQQGRGVKGSLSWSPVGQVVDALDDAFYVSFGNVEASGKRIMLALDVSGSMGVSLNNLPLSAREASACMALVTAKAEPNRFITMFSSAGTNFAKSGGTRYSFGDNGISELDISPRMRLDDAVRRVFGLPFGRTDCSLPMQYALQRNMNVDLFVIYTDNETWHGEIHPSQALREYRRKVNPNARLVVVGMTSTGFSIADPKDAGMLDVVGFDTSTPQVISEFAK